MVKTKINTLNMSKLIIDGSHQPACVPSITKWEKTTEKDSINGMKKLTINSTCKCSQGAQLSFIYSSENYFATSKI